MNERTQRTQTKGITMKVIIGITIALVIGSIASSNLIGMIGSIKAQLDSII